MYALLLPTLTFFLVSLDGTPSPRVNQGSQQKLLTAMYKYQGAFETTKEKEAALRVALEDARATLVRR
jgi:hypothetical protein